MRKYRNQKVTIDGIQFDSKKEAKRYAVLKYRESEGEIRGLRLQVPYVLIPKHTVNGHTIRQCVYKADFVYLTKDGQIIVEDVKGFKTDIYKLKKKLFSYRYGIEITEV